METKDFNPELLGRDLDISYMRENLYVQTPSKAPVSLKAPVQLGTIVEVFPRENGMYIIQLNRIEWYKLDFKPTQKELRALFPCNIDLIDYHVEE